MENKNTEKIKKGRFTYLINRDNGTAWIANGSTGRKKKYTLPRSVLLDGREYVCESVEIGAFCGNRKIQHLIIPDTYKYIDEDCFKWCSNLKSVHIGKGLEYYFKWTFGGCPRLKRVTIDSSNRFIKVSSDGNLVMTKDGKKVLAVIDSRSPKSLSVPEGVENIAEGGISCCDSLSSISLPSTLREIGPNGISWLPNLRSLEIPESVTTMGIQAISFNEKLEELTLPHALKGFDNSLLEGNISLRKVICKNPALIR